MAVIPKRTTYELFRAPLFEIWLFNYLNQTYAIVKYISDRFAFRNAGVGPIKTDDQLDLQALHRVCDRLVSRLTGVINQLRAFLLERGITVRQGRAYLRRTMPLLLPDAERTSGNQRTGSDSTYMDDTNG